MTFLQHSVAIMQHYQSLTPSRPLPPARPVSRISARYPATSRHPLDPSRINSYPSHAKPTPTAKNVNKIKGLAPATTCRMALEFIPGKLVAGFAPYYPNTQ